MHGKQPLKGMRKAILLVLLLACGTAQADEPPVVTAAEMASWCQPFKDAVLNGAQISKHSTAQSQVCLGAFLTFEYLASTSWTAPYAPTKNILKTCIPAGATTTDLIKVFLLYAEEHPERGHYKFTDILLWSLQAAYPCPTGTKPK